MINRILIGGFFMLLGLVLIVFHKRIRKLTDRLNKYDPLLRQGDWWTGRYTKGGLIVTHTMTILLGVLCFIAGVLAIFGVVG